MESKKNKVLKKILLVLVLTLSITILFALTNRKPTFADSGFGTSYSGGSSSSSGSSHSSSSYSSSSSGSGRHSSSSGSPIATLIGIGIFVVILIWMSLAERRRGLNQPQIQYTFDEEAIENKIKQYLPDFNKEEFLNSGYKIYLDVQDAWMNFKLEDVKDVITDELYNMYESQLTTLEVKGEQNVMKDFTMQRSFLKDVSMQNNTLTITTGYIIEFYDYIIEQASGKVVRGTDNRKVRVTYEMKFRQTLDESKKVTKCPNCGADIEMNTTGVCDYCHTKLVTENTKWVLTEKQTINQEYV